MAVAVSGLTAGEVLDRDERVTVHAASDADGRDVYLTVANKPFTSELARAAFLSWADRVRSVSGHPYVAELVDVDLTEDNRPYVAIRAAHMTLAARLRSGPISTNGARDLGIAVADALDAALSHGLVHGAIRPTTVLIGDDGTPQLGGFDTTAPGLAGRVVTTAYTPPEHQPASDAGELALTPAGDVYGLAATLYTALGGVLPWVDAPDDIDARRTSVPGIRGVPRWLVDVLRGGLAFDPASRPSVAVVREALAGEAVPEPAPVPMDDLPPDPFGEPFALQGLPDEAEPFDHRPPPISRRAAVGVRLGMVALLALVISGVGVTSYFAFRAANTVPAPEVAAPDDEPEEDSEDLPEVPADDPLPEEPPATDPTPATPDAQGPGAVSPTPTEPPTDTQPLPRPGPTRVAPAPPRPAPPNPYAALVGRWIGNYAPPDRVPPRYTMTVYSDGRFRLDGEKPCTGRIVEVFGPREFRSSMTCTWGSSTNRITVPLDHRLNMWWAADQCDIYWREGSMAAAQSVALAPC